LKEFSASQPNSQQQEYVISATLKNGKHTFPRQKLHGGTHHADKNNLRKAKPATVPYNKQLSKKAKMKNKN